MNVHINEVGLITIIPDNGPRHDLGHVGVNVHNDVTIVVNGQIVSIRDGAIISPAEAVEDYVYECVSELVDTITSEYAPSGGVRPCRTPSARANKIRLPHIFDPQYPSCCWAGAVV